MADMKHGTRNAYNKGCRCRKCSDANAAHQWAAGHLKDIDRPFISRVSITDALTVGNGAYEIPREAILKTLKDMAKEIELRLLSALWHKNKKDDRRAS